MCRVLCLSVGYHSHAFPKRTYMAIGDGIFFQPSLLEWVGSFHIDSFIASQLHVKIKAPRLQTQTKSAGTPIIQNQAHPNLKQSHLCQPGLYIHSQGGVTQRSAPSRTCSPADLVCQVMVLFCSKFEGNCLLLNTASRALNYIADYWPLHSTHLEFYLELSLRHWPQIAKA